MKTRTIILTSTAVFVISGSGAFATTRYVTKSFGLKSYAAKVAERPVASGHIPYGSQADAIRTFKTSDVR